MPSKYRSSLGRTLDARPDRLDLRDRECQPQLPSLPPRWPVDPDLATWIPEYVAAGLVLEPGDEGACTGFGLAGMVDYLLLRRRISATVHDGWHIDLTKQRSAGQLTHDALIGDQADRRPEINARTCLRARGLQGTRLGGAEFLGSRLGHEGICGASL